ncbi:MAG: hypothetical protein ACRENL_10660 [Candidatus Dormibacteria bacterium]
MGRSLGVVLIGGSCGFLLAVAAGTNRATNLQLASMLWAAAGLGAAILAVLLLVMAIGPRVARRRAAGPAAGVPSDPRAPAARPVEVRADRAAARIAALEARLALEQEQLDAAVQALAATDVAGAVAMPARGPEEGADAASGDDEPALREEVIETFAAMVSTAQRTQAADLARRLETLLEDAG